MTKEQLITNINRYVRNSAVDSYTDLRLNSILLAIVGGGVSGYYATFEEFQAAYEASPDEALTAFVSDVSAYGFNDVDLKYIPGVGVSVAGLQLIIDIR